MKAENFVIVTFDDEKNAIEASHKMQDLAVRGDIAMGYSVILRKHENGEIEALKKTTINGVVEWTGMFVGVLVGLFFGPLGFLISTLAGTAIGVGVEHAHEKFEDDFVNKVQDTLDDGKIAIIANCIESNPVFLNNAIKDLDGQILRTTAT